MTMLTSLDGCRSCGSGDLVEVLDLGEQRLSDFRADESEPPRYPLVLVMCMTCGLVQLGHTAPRSEMYHERYGFKSGVSEVIRADLESIVDEAFDTRLANVKAVGRWLDIGSNDGTLLAYVPGDVNRVGVDPLAQLADEARTHADEIFVGFFDPAMFGGHRFDVVTSVSMFYDLDDPNEFVAGVRQVMAPDGIWVVQQNYALDMLADTVFDNICHEHVTYFSLSTLAPLLARNGLEVVDVGFSPVNGGCIRTTIAKVGTLPASRWVERTIRFELAAGVDTLARWDAFASATRERLREVQRFVVSAVDHGQKVAIYGASTRGATIWQSAGLDARHFCYAVERQGAKVGRYMSAVGVPIVSEETFRTDLATGGQPSYAVVGPWFFRDAINKREKGYLEAGGRLVYPLPKLEVMGS